MRYGTGGLIEARNQAVYDFLHEYTDASGCSGSTPTWASRRTRWNCCSRRPTRWSGRSSARCVSAAGDRVGWDGWPAYAADPDHLRLGHCRGPVRLCGALGLSARHGDPGQRDWLGVRRHPPRCWRRIEEKFGPVWYDRFRTRRPGNCSPRICRCVSGPARWRSRCLSIRG